MSSVCFKHFSSLNYISIRQKVIISLFTKLKQFNQTLRIQIFNLEGLNVIHRKKMYNYHFI
jgi:hypothetical protein